MKKEEKAPLFCRLLGHDWKRRKDLDLNPREQACKCARCGKIMYIKQ
jgi:hypothetical protein